MWYTWTVITILVVIIIFLFVNKIIKKTTTETIYSDFNNLLKVFNIIPAYSDVLSTENTTSLGKSISLISGKVVDKNEITTSDILNEIEIMRIKDPKQKINLTSADIAPKYIVVIANDSNGSKFTYNNQELYKTLDIGNTVNAVLLHEYNDDTKGQILSITY